MYLFFKKWHIQLFDFVWNLIENIPEYMTVNNLVLTGDYY